MLVQLKKDTLTLMFYGELDHYTIQKIKEEAIMNIEKYKPKVVRLDFKKVSFIDSSGIGFVLSRYKQVKAYQGMLVVCDLSLLNRKIFEMSGIFQLVKEEKNGVLL